jgi:DNA-binding NtrC family response regulator
VIEEASQTMSDPSVESGPARPTILVVDDERNIRRTLDLVLRGEGFDVVEAGSAEIALEILERGDRPVDLAILDIMLPGMSGVELLAKLRQDEATRGLPAIVISGHASLEDAAQAIKLGAADFFEKPLNRDRVLVSVRNALRTSSLARTVEELSAKVLPRYEMIGQGAAMKRLFGEIERVAPTKASVLVTGETGTGKELIAQAIHRASARAEKPFVKVNCAAIPRELIENELFGHERGAFTGADARRRGLFEVAHGGTLFLDEIGDMDLAAQAKVLRALANGEVVRLGGDRPVSVDVRVLAATNKDLKAAVARGTFREDLYFRLAVFPIQSPSLADRMEDVPALADAFLAAFCKENGLRRKTIAPSVYAELGRRRFPGNVRELRNVIERAAILSSDEVTIADLPEDPHASPFDDDGDPASAEGSGDRASAEPPARASQTDVASAASHPRSEVATAAADGSRPTLREVRERAERRYIVEILDSLEWNISRAAVVLGMERTNVHKRIRQYGIKRGERPAT